MSALQEEGAPLIFQIAPGRLRWLLAELAAAGVNVLGIERAADGSILVSIDPIDADAANVVAQEVVGYTPTGRKPQQARRHRRPIDPFDIFCGASILAFGVLGTLSLMSSNVVGAAFFALLAGVTAVLGPRFSNEHKRAMGALKQASVPIPARMRVAGWFDNVGFLAGAACLLAVASAAIWFYLQNGALR